MGHICAGKRQPCLADQNTRLLFALRIPLCCPLGGSQKPTNRGLTTAFRVYGAEDEIRTRDLLLGKEAFYH